MLSDSEPTVVPYYEMPPFWLGAVRFAVFSYILSDFGGSNWGI